MSFTIRQAQIADLPTIEKVNSQEGYEIGMHNIELYYSLSPKHWRIFETPEGTIVGYESFNKMNNGVWFAYSFVVLEEYRNKKISHLTRLHTDGFPNGVIGNTTKASIDRFSKIFQGWAFKLLQFTGVINAKSIQVHPVKEVTIVDLQGPGQLFQDVVSYDAGIVKFERKKFLSGWLLAKKYSNVKVAVQHGVVVGYGVRREVADYYGLYPCYADTDQIAKLLMTSIVKAADGKDCFFACPANSRIAIKIAHAVGMTMLPTEVQNLSTLAKPYLSSLDLKKVYTVHDYYCC